MQPFEAQWLSETEKWMENAFGTLAFLSGDLPEESSISLCLLIKLERERRIHNSSDSSI